MATYFAAEIQRVSLMRTWFLAAPVQRNVCALVPPQTCNNMCFTRMFCTHSNNAIIHPKMGVPLSIVAFSYRHVAMPLKLPNDFQDEILATGHEEFLERQIRKEEERRAETVRTEWCYGPQKLNYVELKKASWHRKRGNETSAESGCC